MLPTMQIKSIVLDLILNRRFTKEEKIIHLLLFFPLIGDKI